MNPVFMFGFDRSGTTLLSMMVGAHPSIAVPLSTTGMWYDIYEELEATDKSLEAIVDQMLAHPRIQLWDQNLDKDKLMAVCRENDYGSIVAAFHNEYAQASGKPYWASMDIATIDHMHWVNQWLSEAKFVHIVRDGRDVALSHQSYIYGAGNIAECGEKWQFRVNRNIRMGGMLPADRYHLLRYEDLILQPEETLSKLCEFMGVDFSPAMLDYKSSVAKKVPEDKMFLWPALKDAPNPSKVDRWRREMSAAERTVFESRASELLEELGYEVTGPQASTLAVECLEFKYFLGRGHRWQRLKAKFKKD